MQQCLTPLLQPKSPSPHHKNHTLFARSNLSIFYAFMKKPFTSALHQRKVLDHLVIASDTLASSALSAAFCQPHIMATFLYNHALTLMLTKSYYDAFHALKYVLALQQQPSISSTHSIIFKSHTHWTVHRLVKLLLRAAECCIHHHKSNHQSPNGKCILQWKQFTTSRRQYHVIR